MKLIPDLVSQGYKLMTVSELAAAKNVTLQNTTYSQFWDSQLQAGTFRDITVIRILQMEAMHQMDLRVLRTLNLQTTVLQTVLMSVTEVLPMEILLMAAVTAVLGIPAETALQEMEVIQKIMTLAMTAPVMMTRETVETLDTMIPETTMMRIPATIRTIHTK